MSLAVGRSSTSKCSRQAIIRPTISSPYLNRCRTGVAQHRLTAPLALISTFAAAYVHYHSTTSASNVGCATHLEKRSRLDIPSARRAQGRSLASLATDSPRHEHTEPPPSQSTTKNDSSSKEEEIDVDDINALMRHPALLTDIKVPRNPIVLCHGLYGFDVRGPFWGLEIHYWAGVLDILRKKVGAEVIVRGVPGTGAIADRAKALHKFLCSEEAGVRGKKINFVGHSMGGLDARYLISQIQPEEYTPVSLTAISTPNRGSPFMDWCNANVGTGQQRVEEEIRKAKEKLKVKSSASEGYLSSEAQAPVNKKDFEKDEIRNPPFSLKTPLFVRPDTKSESPAKGHVSDKQEDETSSEPIVEKAQSVATGVAAGIVQMAVTPTQLLSSSSSNESSEDSESSASAHDEKKSAKSSNKNKNSGGSLLDFSAFSRALGSLGGSFSSYMLSVLDQPAYAMLSTRYMAQVFNPTTPDSPNVAYFSVAARKRSLPIYHPLWLPKLVLDSAAESRSAGGERDGSADALGGASQGNDGLVSVESAKWGTFLGVVEGCDHWDLRGGGAPRWKGKVNPQTGKPLAKQEAESAPDTQESKEKDGSAGWSEINRIVRKLFSTSAEKAEKKDKEAAESNADGGREKKHSSWVDTITSIVPGDAAKKKVEDGLVNEVASWISDRLPKGDQDRRAQAEQAAEAQHKEHLARQNQIHTTAPPSQAETINKPDNLKFPHSSITSESDLQNTTAKLRREAAWQEELGHTGAARDLRRELAWHRAEWDKTRSKSSSNGQSNGHAKSKDRPKDWDMSAPKRADKKDTNASPASSADEFERFWFAICRHLWAKGF